MIGANAIGLNQGKTICGREAWANKIEVDAGRVATWTLIFTNTFFVSYFFAKLFQWV